MSVTHTTAAHADEAVRVETWGEGAPVVLVHGSLAIGTEEWAAQRPLADEGFRLLVPDRRGYGASPAATGEDFLRDADDVAELMDGGAHLVGHSYGGISVMLAAARRPEATRSLTVLEPAALGFGRHDPAAQALEAAVRDLWDRDLDDEAWVTRFLELVGSDPADLTPELIAEAVASTPVFRQGRPFWEADIPVDVLAAAPFPKLVVSGGHHQGFEAICDELATRIGARRRQAVGAGHEVQFAADAVNPVLLDVWRAGDEARSSSAPEPG